MLADKRFRIAAVAAIALCMAAIIVMVARGGEETTVFQTPQGDLRVRLTPLDMARGANPETVVLIDRATGCAWTAGLPKGRMPLIGRAIEPYGHDGQPCPGYRPVQGRGR